MITLYTLQECPHCEKVRKTLGRLRLDYQVVNVPKLGSLRKEVLALEGVDVPEVPALVDGDKVIQDSDEIIDYLNTEYGDSYFGDPHYGLTRVLDGVAFADAIPMVREALVGEGFGVLTEIDVKATMKAKLNEDFRNYVILGACNPPLAHQALTNEPAIGLLLPCNVVVTEEDDGRAVVSAIDPFALFNVLDRPDIRPLAMQVRKKIAAALTAIKA